MGRKEQQQIEELTKQAEERGKALEARDKELSEIKAQKEALEQAQAVGLTLLS